MKSILLYNNYVEIYKDKKHMDKVVHFEIPAEDLDRAKKFYSSIFGWELQDMPMPDGSNYIGIWTIPVDEKTRMPKEPGAINGGMMKRTDKVRTPVVAINVNSIDDRVAKITAMGGKIVVPKVEIGGMGYYAYMTDTEGNVIGLWEDIKKE